MSLVYHAIVFLWYIYIREKTRRRTNKQYYSLLACLFSLSPALRTIRAPACAYESVATKPQLQKGGVPAAPSGTATLLRLSPSYRVYPRTLLLRSRTSGTHDSHGLTGGVYKARERIHRAMADARLLANPASRSRVADSDPNWDGFLRFAFHRWIAALCTHHCNTCVAPDVRAVLI